MVDDDARKEINKKIAESTIYWNAVIKNLTDRTRGDIKDVVIEVQPDAISQRQIVAEEVKTYAVKIHKLVAKVKMLSKAKYEFYATSYQIKTSGAEKLKLIEYDLAQHQEFINELDEHVNFLRDTAKNLDNVNYAVKNRIELANILGV
jgi:coenzyme F420-reducing hydrogenase alpha subunit